MPELPEVETARRGLAPVLAGALVVAVRAARPDLRLPLPERFAARLTGATVERLDRRAKYLLAPLSTGETLVMHLGMSGRFLVAAGAAALSAPGAFYQAGAANAAHTHVVIETRTASGAAARIEYNDPRRFGFMLLLDTGKLAQDPLFRALGPEPLGEGFSAAYLFEAFAGRKQSVKAALLDQHVVAGLGNIYVSEALHRAGISPRRAAGRVSAGRLEDLALSVREVLTEAIAAGGSSLKDYAHTDGSLGYFQHRFRVYDREGEACPAPGCAGKIKRVVQAGRSSFFCPRCQH